MDIKGVIIMKKMTKSANLLYNLFNIFFWLTIFATCAVVVATVIILFFDISPDTLEIGMMTFDLNTDAVNFNDFKLKLIMITQMLSAIVSCVFAVFICKKLKDILRPIKNGEPFMDSACKNVRKLGNIMLIFGIASAVAQIVSTIALGIFMGDYGYIFTNDYILSCSIINKYDISWVIGALFMYLIAYIFDYGKQLQELSDETL